MATIFESDIHDQLIYRRKSLEKGISLAPKDLYLSNLLKEVDTALTRLESGTFGMCETCPLQENYYY